MLGNANDVTASPLTPPTSGYVVLTPDRLGNNNSAYDFSDISTARIKYNSASKLNLPSNQSLSISVWFFARSSHASPSQIFRIVCATNSSFEIFMGHFR
jgi:hypothetical protein